MKFKANITKEFDISREAINKYMIGKGWILKKHLLINGFACGVSIFSTPTKSYCEIPLLEEDINILLCECSNKENRPIEEILEDWILIDKALKRDYVDDEYINSVIEKHKIIWGA